MIEKAMKCVNASSGRADSNNREFGGAHDACRATLKAEAM
jgi:hypothetical protein